MIEVRYSGSDVILIIVRGDEEDTEKALAQFKAELLALKKEMGQIFKGSNLFLVGVNPFEAAFTVETFRSHVRNIFIQDAKTGNFLKVAGIDPDSQVIEALFKVKEALSAIIPPTRWRAICLDCRHIWEAVGLEPTLCPKCRSPKIAARKEE